MDPSKSATLKNKVDKGRRDYNQSHDARSLKLDAVKIKLPHHKVAIAQLSREAVICTHLWSVISYIMHSDFEFPLNPTSSALCCVLTILMETRQCLFDLVSVHSADKDQQDKLAWVVDFIASLEQEVGVVSLKMGSADITRDVEQNSESLDNLLLAPIELIADRLGAYTQEEQEEMSRKLGILNLRKQTRVQLGKGYNESDMLLDISSRVGDAAYKVMEMLGIVEMKKDEGKKEEAAPEWAVYLYPTLLGAWGATRANAWVSLRKTHHVHLAKMREELAGLKAFDQEMQGYLNKKGGTKVWGQSPWDKRWFVLAANTLWWYKTPQEYTQQSEARGCISCEEIIEIYEGTDSDTSFAIVIGKTRVFELEASLKYDRDRWIDALSKAARSRQRPFSIIKGAADMATQKLTLSTASNRSPLHSPASSSRTITRTQPLQTGSQPPTPHDPHPTHHLSSSPSPCPSPNPALSAPQPPPGKPPPRAPCLPHPSPPPTLPHSVYLPLPPTSSSSQPPPPPKPHPAMNSTI